jgi:cytochrome P450
LLDSQPAMLRRAKMKPPGPRGMERIHLIKRLTEPKILDAVSGVWKTYGDTAAVSLPFGRTLYFLNDPADVMDVLVRRNKKFIKGKDLETFKLLIGHGVATSEQSDWVQHRRMVQPNFHHKILESYVPTVLQAVKEHRNRWLEAGDSFQDFNVLFPQLSQDIVARTILGADLSSQLEQIHRAWDGAMDFVLARTFTPVPFPIGWPLPSHRRFNRSARFIRDTVDAVIAQQMEENVSADSNTFLARLLRSNAAGDLTRVQIREQVLNVLFAGLETTANALSSALYLILSHPHVQQKLIAELHAVLGKDSPSYGTLQKQPYLRQVVYETLRLYPPVCIIPREALEEVELSTVVLPRGASVIVSPYVIHRHPKLWSDPERFEPERFDNPSLTKPPNFLAFGAGGRTCVGDQFAINEMMLILSDIFQNLHPEMDTSRPIGFFFNGTLRPQPMRIRVSALH